MTTEEFIIKVRAIHGNKYDYSKVEYINSSTKVCIICPKHGEFLQKTYCHLEGQGCPQCAKIIRSTKLLKWNQNTCFIEAQKYTSRAEFEKKAGAAYRTALQHKWLDDYTWFVSSKVSKHYWNQHTCRKEAQKYTSRTAFAKEASTAYHYACKNGWIDEYTWFIQGCTPAGFWTYERCFAAAKTCETRKEFREKYGRAYKVSKANQWLEKFNWLGVKFVWTYDLCKLEALKYETKQAFQKGNCGAYTAAVRKKWINTFDWFVQNRVNIIEGKVDCVYSYYFKDFNTIYIGRTIRPKDRDREHIFNDKNDAVAKFVQLHNCAVPPMLIIEDNLTLAEGQKREDYWIKHYQQLGYIVLNKAQTGLGKGSLGAIGAGKWNKQTCYTEALKYHNRKEFQRENVGAYTRALERGWIKDYTWFKRPKNWNAKWTEKACYEEAQKYQTPKGFETNSSGAYAAAIKNGWISQYDWFLKVSKPVGYWTYDKCYEEAKKYKSRSEFEYGKGSGTAYKIARQNNWLKDYTWFISKQKPKGYWTYDKCYEEAQKYKSRSEFEYGKGSSRAYYIARKNNWLKDYTWFSQTLNSKKNTSQKINK